MKVYINGIETEIHVPTDESVVTYKGNSNDYEVKYDNLLEKGGIVTVEANPITDNVVEGFIEITLPFEILNAQATALNYQAGAETCFGESAFIKIQGKKLVIYATANSSSKKQLKAVWNAKGII